MMNKMCMAAVIAASLYAGTTFAQPAAVKKIIETGQNRQEKKTKINFNNKNRENEKNYVLCRIVDGSDFYFVYKR